MTQPEKNTLETILVVEQKVTVRDVLHRILEHAGYCVLTAATGAQALQTSNAHGTIHLLLANVMLPDMSGPAVAHTLKKHRPDLRVLLIEGYPDGNLLLLNHGWHFIKQARVAAELIDRVHELLHTPERSQGDYQFDPRITPVAAKPS